MKTLFISTFISFFGFCTLLGQQSQEETNAINFYIKIKPNSAFGDNVKEKLETKINNLVLEQTQGGTDENHFVIYVIANITDDEVTPTAPPMYKVGLDIQLIVADVVQKRKYNSYTFSVKGFNRNKQKAIIRSFDRIKSNLRFKKFIAEAKSKILEYYGNECTFVITRASNLSAQGKYEEAIKFLDAVPSVSEDCFFMAQSKIAEITKNNQKIDQKELEDIIVQNEMLDSLSKKSLDSMPKILIDSIAIIDKKDAETDTLSIMDNIEKENLIIGKDVKNIDYEWIEN